MRILFVILFTSLLCGCRTKGNLGDALVQKIAHYGGHTQSTGQVPELRGAWTFQPDAEGFQAHLSGVTFDNVRSFMQQVYGAPVSLSTKYDSPPSGHVFYRAADIGVGIEFFSESNGVTFVCQRGHAYPLE